MLKKMKVLEDSVNVISNIACLYASDYLKTTYGLNLFDDPLTIE